MSEFWEGWASISTPYSKTYNRNLVLLTFLLTDVAKVSASVQEIILKISLNF